MTEKFNLVDEQSCAVCPLLTEVTAALEVTVEAIEHGTWTIQTLAQARRALTRVRALTTPHFTCPRCGMKSYHPQDIAEGYCGHCHDWTREPATVST